MTVRDRLVLQALLAAGLVLSMVFTGVAVASSGAPSSEFVWGSLLTVGMALATGYTYGVDKRIDKLEARTEQRFSKVDGEVATAISLANGYNAMLGERITNLQTSLPRPEEFARVVRAIDRIHERLDQLLPHRGTPS